MKLRMLRMLVACALISPAFATTITVVPVYEPLSLHGTDGDEAITEIGEALQAAIFSRPMALTGAFPEVLVDSIRTPHPIPANNPNYEVKEANLLILCGIGLTGEMTEQGLLVRFDISQLAIPGEVDLTGRQVLKLATVALRKTLEEYQRPQTQPLVVKIVIEGASEAQTGLQDLGFEFVLGQPANAN